MCKSTAEGGQRCVGRTAVALVAAETKYAAVASISKEYLDAGNTVPPDLHTAGLKAVYNLADARARHASTPQGEADLTARMDALAVYGNAPDYHTNPVDYIDYNDYADAITTGRRLRHNALQVSADVRAGTLSSAEAKTVTQFPTEKTINERKTKIQAATHPESSTGKTTGTRNTKTPVPLDEDEYEMELQSYSQDIKQLCRSEGNAEDHKHWRTQLALASQYYRGHGETEMVDDVYRAVRESFARHRALIGR